MEAEAGGMDIAAVGQGEPEEGPVAEDVAAEEWEAAVDEAMEEYAENKAARNPRVMR